MTTAAAFLPSARLFDYLPETDQFCLTISPRDRARAQLVPGLRFHKATETWRGPASLTVALATRGVFGEALTVTDEAYARAQQDADRDSHVRAVKNGELTPWDPADPAYAGLRPEQIPAAYLAAMRGGFLIADEKGYGKTVEAAAALRKTGDYPALVVATNSMKYTWAAEIGTWCGVSAVAAGRTKAERERAVQAVADGEAQVLIISWAQVPLLSSLAPYGSMSRTDKEKEDGPLNAIPFRTVISDEAHKGANPKAKQTRALWRVGHSPSVKNRWALTATPTTGHTISLWGVLHFIDPEAYPSRSRFIDRFVLTHENPWGTLEDLGLNPATEAEFRQGFDPLHIRRPLRLDVDLLPPQYRFVDMEGKQRTVYNKIAKESIAQVDERFLVAVGPLVLNTRLQQLAQATPVLEDRIDTETGETYVAVASMQLPSCKYDALCDILDEMGDEPLVAFSDSRKLLELCYRELTTGRSPRFRPEQVGLVTGSVDPKDRHRDIEAFQAGTMPLILCSIGAGSEGITLTRASTMVFLNRSYKYVGNNQAEGRLYRHGQTRNVQIIDVIARDSEEMRVHESSVVKEGRLQSVLQDDDWQERPLPVEPGPGPDGELGL